MIKHLSKDENRVWLGPHLRSEFVFFLLSFVGFVILFFQQDGAPFVFEATRKTGPMLIPWSDAKSRYFPAIGVDTHLKVYEYRHSQLIA